MKSKSNNLASKELDRITRGMKHYRGIIIGAWGMAGLYTCLVWGIFDVSSKIGEKVGEPEAFPLAWDLAIILSNVLVIMVAWAITKLTLQMIPRKYRKKELQKKSVWDKQPGPPATIPENVRLSFKSE